MNTGRVKIGLLAIVASVSIILFSSLAMAGGEGCDWKKRGDGHKGMSTEAMKEFKKDHAWFSQEGSANQGKIIINKDSENMQGLQSASRAVGI